VLLDVSVDVPRLDVDDAAILVAELEDLAGITEQLAHQLRHAAVAHVPYLALSRLARKIEMEAVPDHLQVLGSQGSDAVAAVLAGIHLAAGAEVAARQNANDARHDALARHPRPAEIPMHDLAHAR
jgi:predicted Zn-dependent protease